MNQQKKYILWNSVKNIVKYLILFFLCYSLLFLDINFFIVLALIVAVNILFVKIELKYHLATKMAKLIKEEKYEDALNLGKLKNAEQRDDYSRLLMLTAYYKTGHLDRAVNMLKTIDNKKWKTKRVRKILDNWKVKILLDSPYQLN